MNIKNSFYNNIKDNTQKDYLDLLNEIKGLDEEHQYKLNVIMNYMINEIEVL